MSECCICFEIKELKSTEVCSHSFCDKCLLELDECALCRAVIAKPKKPFDDRLMDPLPQKRWKLPRKIRKIDWEKFNPSSRRVENENY